MTLLAVAATFLDMVTVDLASELNPLVTAWWPWIVPLRLAVLAAGFAAAAIAGRPWIRRAVVGVTAVVGTVGWWSNGGLG